MAEFELFQYIYWELTVGLIIVGMVINKAFAMKNMIHLKWVMFVLALIGGVTHYLTHEDSSIWKIVISVGVSVLAYDYVVKVIQDKLNGKNPLKPH